MWNLKWLLPALVEATDLNSRPTQMLADCLLAVIKRLVLPQEEQGNQEALQISKEAQEKDFEILRTVMEETTDQEIEELRAR